MGRDRTAPPAGCPNRSTLTDCDLDRSSGPEAPITRGTPHRGQVASEPVGSLEAVSDPLRSQSGRQTFERLARSVLLPRTVVRRCPAVGVVGA